MEFLDEQMKINSMLILEMLMFRCVSSSFFERDLNYIYSHETYVAYHIRRFACIKLADRRIPSLKMVGGQNHRRREILRAAPRTKSTLVSNTKD